MNPVITNQQEEQLMGFMAGNYNYRNGDIKVNRLGFLVKTFGEDLKISPQNYTEVCKGSEIETYRSTIRRSNEENK